MILSVAQTIVAVLLIAVILLQVQGGGLSTAIGGGFEQYRSRRSFERLLVIATVVLAFAFAVVSMLLPSRSL